VTSDMKSPAATENPTTLALDIRGLWAHYMTPAGAVKAVDGVTFSLKKGETLGLIGESGSGKTSTALALMRLLDPPTQVGGEVLINGENIFDLSENEMRKARFTKIALVTQGAMNSLNPVMRIRPQIADIFSAHGIKMGRDASDKRVLELLRAVDLDPSVAGMYPHELSGGMKQRVVIAMAIALDPDVIIADEPTSALDVVVQRQVMRTLMRVQRDVGAAMILIGHDMGLMAQVVDHAGIMYAGKLVELGPVKEMFANPLHPYTELLVKSLPSMRAKGVFKSIPGLTPSLLDLPSGCTFNPRCPYAEDKCRTDKPEYKTASKGHMISCHLRGLEVSK
jgi:peptide/nickel transport system ATP-binding protein